MSQYSSISKLNLSASNPLLGLSDSDLTTALLVSKAQSWTMINPAFIYTFSTTSFFTVTWASPFAGSVASRVAAIDPTGAGYAKVLNIMYKANLIVPATSQMIADGHYDIGFGASYSSSGGILLPITTPTYSKVYLGHYATVDGSKFDLGGSNLTSIADPVNAQDAVSKKYADSAITALTSSTTADIATCLSSAKSYTDSSISSSSSTLKDSIDAVNSKVDGILAGVEVDYNSLEKVALLAKTLDSAESASLTSAVSSLQTKIDSNDTDITALKTLTSGYATELDTAKVKQAFIDIEESGPFNNSIKTDPETGNLVLSTPTANGSCVVNIPTNWFLTDTIGATSYSSVQFNNSIDMGGCYNQPKKIVNLADATDAHDAVAFHQFTDYKTSNDASVASVISNLGIEAARASTAETVIANNLSNLKNIAIVSTGKTSQSIDGALNLGDVQCNNLNVFFGLDMKTKKIKNVGDGVNSHDAVAFHQLTDYITSTNALIATLQAQNADLQSQLTVQSGYITNLYQYSFNTTPNIAPTR